MSTKEQIAHELAIAYAVAEYQEHYECLRTSAEYDPEQNPLPKDFPTFSIFQVDRRNLFYKLYELAIKDFESRPDLSDAQSPQ